MFVCSNTWSTVLCTRYPVRVVLNLFTAARKSYFVHIRTRYQLRMNEQISSRTKKLVLLHCYCSVWVCLHPLHFRNQSTPSGMRWVHQPGSNRGRVTEVFFVPQSAICGARLFFLSDFSSRGKGFNLPLPSATVKPNAFAYILATKIVFLSK